MARKDCDKNPFISIPASLGGIFLVIVILFLIFAQSYLWVLIPLEWAFVVFGFFALLFAYKAQKKK